MKWIGLTGGIASGKSTVAKILTDLGAKVILADELSRRVTTPGSEGLRQITRTFGHDILDSDQCLDRRKLADIVFSDPKKLLQLEQILHPLIRNETDIEKKKLEAQGESLAFYDVPLLFEKKLEDQFDKVLLINCDQATQISRIKKRDGLNEREAMQRLNAQIPLKDKVLKSHFVINNDGDLETLKKAVKEYFLKLS